MVAAIVMAGGSPSSDKLLQSYGVEAKSLLKIHDKEMIRYVVNALVSSGRIDRLVLLGLQPNQVPHLVPDGIRVEYIINNQPLVDNVLMVLGQMVEEKQVVISTSDIPLITGESVAGFLDECARTEADAYYPIIERSVMEKRFPRSGRSYRMLRDGYFAGGDLFLVRPKVVLEYRERISQLTSARKSAVRIALLFGPKIILKYLFRRLTLAEAEETAWRVFHCRCKAVITRYPELGMDVDKLNQFLMVRDMLEGAVA